MPSSGSLYLVDSHSLIFQVFHAIRGMTSPAGLPTNALFGFIRDILWLRSLEPTYLVCAFDRAEPTFRSELYPDYKAHRDPPPDDLILQVPLIEQAMAALRVPVLSDPRYEADDILATLARAGEKRGLDVFLCTSDKDCRQLISDRVRLFSLRKREEFGAAQLLDDWGIRPDQVVDLQSLVGDSVDNVPGVPGIGVKTAAKLLQEFGTLDNLMANTAKVTGKKREALEAAGETVKLSRSLVKLADDVPIPMEWDRWKVQTPDAEAFIALCKEWGFTGFAAQVRGIAEREGAPPAEPVQRGLFDAPPPAGEELFPFGANVAEDAPARPEEGWGGYALIDTIPAFDALMEELGKRKRFAFDTETTGLDALRADLVGLALSWEAGKGHYVAVRGPLGASTVPLDHVRARLGPILADERVEKVNQNIKYDLLVLRSHGFEVRGVAGDSMVADYLLHSGERGHGLDELSKRLLGHAMIPITDLIGVKKPKKPQLSMDQVPTAQVAEYAGEDADAAWRLATMLEAELGRKGNEPLLALYREMEVPLIDVLARMEQAGIRLDAPYLRKVGEEMAEQIAGLEKEIHGLAGHPFNLASLPQLRTVLFDELRLPVQGRTGTTNAPSTDQETLEKLAALDHPNAAIARKIVEHRQVTKLKGTYVDALPEMVHPRTGRVHTSFNQAAAVTGRLSSSDPNLQNIPVRRENGQQVRRAFLPEAGWALLTADYSQIELRILAHACQDQTLMRAFAERKDIHAAVASQVFKVEEKDVTPEQRRMAKTVNFGVIYGISATGLAVRLHIRKEEATSFIRAYFKQYPRVEAYQADLLRECKRTGYATTLLGRRRKFDTTAIRLDSSPMNRNTAEREAINMEVQGTAADLIKLAMLAVDARMRKENLQARLLLQIHDELVLECPPSELKALSALVREEMTQGPAKRLALRVPLEVDLATGPNWLDVEELP
ncbi:MAG: DNA polymerase I [Gemmataceae bacterium]|nr:DNA polymerase I [Gemmataceae bacterium]